MDQPPGPALRKIFREVQAMVNDPPEGIRMIHSEDMTDIQAWIQGPGDVCVSTLKKDWKKTLGLKHILLVVKCLLIVPNPESALNEDAGRLLLERYDDYAQRAKMWTTIHAQSAGKDVFTPSKRAGVEAQDSSKDIRALSSASSSSSAINTREIGGELAAGMESTVTTLAVKEASKSGLERACVGDEQSSTTAPSTSSSSSSSSLLESNLTATMTTIPTKRKPGSAENRIEHESVTTASSSTSSCSSSSPFCAGTGAMANLGRLPTSQHQQHQQQQPRTVLTAQRNSSTSLATTSAQSKPQSPLLARQTLQGPPSALRNQGQNLLQKQMVNSNGVSLSDQLHGQQQQEQLLPKDDLQQGTLNHNTNHIMLSPKIAHNGLLGVTASTTFGPEGSTLSAVKFVTTSRSTTITTTSISPSIQHHHPQTGLAGSCSTNFSLSQQQSNGSSAAAAAVAPMSMLRSSYLVAPHNLSSLSSHVRPELHVDKKRALRRL
ncbi:hypothetical protein BGZ95_002067 [Linnemannia exigua]|uniref:UBC core domain-containing protein n=1 Tax=Linnemannia exigua TaxID=604196 RepID=A0AAD4D5Z4_9FUNG|nr:hypothetical protein BGZ95_002067 [Linnemannia exigua]